MSSSLLAVAVDGRSDEPLLYAAAHSSADVPLLLLLATPSAHSVATQNPFVYERDVPAPELAAAQPRHSVEQVREHYMGVCARAGRRCELVPIEYQWNGGPNAIGDALCRAASQLHVRQLVLGFRGVSATQRLAMGSVSSRCVLACDTTVTVAKPPRHLSTNDTE